MLEIYQANNLGCVLGVLLSTELRLYRRLLFTIE